jgi:hypothetical protein
MIAAPPQPATDEVIVCFDGPHAVLDGLVACPLRAGTTTPVSECADCHLLIWRADDWRRLPSCSTDPEREGRVDR